MASSNPQTKAPQAPYTKMTAEVYDQLYAWKNYRQEAFNLQRIIDDHQLSDGRQLLDAACGTGSHLEYLQDQFAITGLDKSVEQLAAAKRKLPKLKFLEADLLNFQLDQQYDVITCLFGSISYLTELAQIRQAIANMANHLRPGGVLIIEPFTYKEDYRPGQVSARFVNKPALKISRIFTQQTDGLKAVWVMHHLVGRPTGVEYFIERHELGLHSAIDYQQAATAAGLRVSPEINRLSGIGSSYKSNILLIAIQPPN